VLSGGGDETLRVWDADSGLRSCVRVFKEHTGAVWCCSWSPADGGRRWALSGSRDKTLRVFDVDTGACVTQFEGHGGSVHACGWSLGESAGRRIVSGSADRTIRVWDSHTGTCEQVLRGHTAAVMCAVWSEADGGCRWVLSGSDDKTLRVWDAATGACERILEGHSDPVLCCALSTAEGGRRWAISGSWDKNVHLWDCCALLVKKKETNMQKSLVKKLSGHTAPVYCCSWSTADGGARWALTGAYDETLRVWAVGSGTCLRTLHGHTRWVRSCAWSRSNGGKRWLVSGSRDKTVRVWELQWDGDNVPNDVKIEALSSSQVDMEEHPELHPDKRRMQQRAAAPPGAHALTNGADHGNGKEEQERARNVLLQSDHGALKEMLANDVEDLKRSLSSAEEERDVARALLQSKDAEAASLRVSDPQHPPGCCERPGDDQSRCADFSWLCSFDVKSWRRRWRL
jgi:WD40 repeat protein